VLNEDQRRRLLKLARESIEAVLEGRVPERSADEFDGDLRRPAGTFVTLRTQDGDLRGCIGSIRAHEPLYRAVISSAINAAFRDPRFLPVRRDELPELELEISVMGPIEPVERIEEIEVGRDGLILSRGRFAGLLLPQVATEYRWDRETFLDQTCIKAGMRPGSWRERDCTIEKFSAEVFGEE
jgi:AmmeMemoRadiSam system protein A